VEVINGFQQPLAQIARIGQEHPVERKVQADPRELQHHASEHERNAQQGVLG
jgi:hypothetical protein